MEKVERMMKHYKFQKSGVLLVPLHWDTLTLNEDKTVHSIVVSQVYIYVKCKSHSNQIFSGNLILRRGAGLVCLECQDESDDVLTKRIIVLCMFVKTNYSLINPQQELQWFNAS